jgi:hypothetical protein
LLDARLSLLDMRFTLLGTRFTLLGTLPAPQGRVNESLALGMIGSEEHLTNLCVALEPNGAAQFPAIEPNLGNAILAKHLPLASPSRLTLWIAGEARYRML